MDDRREGVATCGTHFLCIKECPRAAEKSLAFSLMYDMMSGIISFSCWPFTEMKGFVFRLLKIFSALAGNTVAEE